MVRRLALLPAALTLLHPAGTQAGGPPIEIPYYLPVDLAQLELTVVKETSGIVEKKPAESSGGPIAWKFSRAVAARRSGRVDLRTVADASAPRVLLVPKATFSDVAATVIVSESGLLVGINAGSEGRGGDALLAVAKFAAVASGFAPVTLAVPASSVVIPEPDGATPPALPDPVPTGCFPLADLDAEGVAAEMQALVSLDPAGCAAFRQWRDSKAKVESMRLVRDRIAGEVAEATGAELTAATRRLQSYRAELAYAEAVQEQRRAALATRYEHFAAERCLGDRSASKSFPELLGLEHLPSAERLGWLLAGSPLDRRTVRASLAGAGWSEALRIFESSGFVVTADGVPVATTASSAPPAAASEVAWRSTIPIRLRIWTLQGDADPVSRIGNGANACAPVGGDDPDSEAMLGVAFEQVLDVLHPASPVRTVPIEAKAFSDRSLAVSFDAHGRPQKFVTSGTASVAGFAQAAAAAAQGFRDESKKTLETRVDIEEARRELALGGLQERIETLELQKDEIDARAELLGASNGFEDLIARQRLDSELALVEAQVALRTAEATADHRVAIAELEQQILELKKRLALLEAQRALAGGGSSN